MAMSNAQRQAKYREKHQATHKTIEVVLKQNIYDRLQSLSKSSGKSRKEIISELILNAHLPESLQVTIPTVNQENKNAPDDNSLPVTKKPLQSDSKVVKLWHGVYRCQSSRTNGKPCRIETNVEIISFTFKNQIYQALSCQQHKKSFSIHPNHF